MENSSVCLICGSKYITKNSKGKFTCKSCNTSYIIPKKENTAASIYESSVQSILEINSVLGSDELSGTGIVISEKGYVITSAHIIAGNGESSDKVKNYCDSITAKRASKRSDFELEPIYVDEKSDIALLYSKHASGISPIKTAKSGAKTGERICVIGNSKGEGLCIIDGIVSDNQRTINSRNFIMISAPVTTGCSGGPVFNSDGEMIGMVSCGREGTVAMNYAISSSTISSFLDEAVKANNLTL